MGAITGKKKYTKFFAYAKAVILVLNSEKRKFTTKEFIKAFNVLRESREKGFDPKSDKAATAANDTLRTLTGIGCVYRIRKGIYTFLNFNESDARAFNKIYLFKKDPAAAKRRFNS